MDRNADATGRRRPPLRLDKLVDVAVLQDLQDGFAETTGVSVAIRGPQGDLLTRSSHTSALCRAIHACAAGREACRLSNQRAYTKAAEAVAAGGGDEPVRYVCHAGLTQFAAPIAVGSRCLATLVVGDRPTRPLSEASVRRIAERLGLDAERLLEHARELKPWSEEEMRRAIRFLHSVAGAIAELGYRGYLVRQRLKELQSLYETSRLLTSTLDLQEVLNIIARHVTRALGMQACSIRLLERGGRELAIRSFYNLSRTYVEKGPVIVARSRIDQQVLKGRTVTVKDMTRDPRILYPEEAKREGLRSAVAVPLLVKDRPLGALHLYSGEVRTFGRAEVQTIRAMANHAAVAIENARLFRESEEKRELDKEMLAAQEIQERLLPLRSPEVPGFDIAAASHPSRRVGGDFYDFIPLEGGRLGLVIADVSGKGMPAAILMAGARAALRAQAEGDAGTRPAVLLDRVNKALCRDTSSSQFVSIFYGVLNPATGYLVYANAGHNRPLLAGRRDRWLKRGGLVVGAVPDATYRPGRAHVEKGDVLVLYTDGVTEAMDAERRPFGPERLQRVVRTHRRRRAATILQSVREAVRTYADQRLVADDLTLMVLRRR